MDCFISHTPIRRKLLYNHSLSLHHNFCMPYCKSLLCHCDKIPDRNNLKEENFCFLTVLGQVHSTMVGKVLAVRAGVGSLCMMTWSRSRGWNSKWAWAINSPQNPTSSGPSLPPRFQPLQHCRKTPEWCHKLGENSYSNNGTCLAELSWSLSQLPFLALKLLLSEQFVTVTGKVRHSQGCVADEQGWSELSRQPSFIDWAEGMKLSQSGADFHAGNWWWGPVGMSKVLRHCVTLSFHFYLCFEVSIRSHSWGWESPHLECVSKVIWSGHALAYTVRTDVFRNNVLSQWHHLSLWV